MNVTSVALLYSLAAALLAALFLYGLLFRRVPSALPFTLIMLFAALWNVLYALEIAFTPLPLKALCAQLRFIPITAVTLLWFDVALHRSGNPTWLSGKRLLLFLAEPAAATALALTSPWHSLFRFGYTVDAAAAVPVLRYANGPLFYIHYVYTYCLIALTFTFLLRSLRRSQAFHARNTGLVILGVLFMLVPDILFQFGVTPIRGINVSPLFMVGTCAILALAFFQFRLLELPPIAGSTVVRTIQEPVLVFDKENRLIEFNPKAGEMLGLRQESHMGQALEDIGLPWSERIGQALWTEGARESISLLLADGEHVFDCTVTRIGDARGAPIGRLVLLYDMTERRKTQDALRQSEEALQQARKMEAVGRLAGGIAHDFNNLLTVIGGYCDIMSEKLPPHDPLLEDIGEIKLASNRAGALTARLLAFSRLQVLQTRVIRINELVGSMKGMLARLIGEDIALAVKLAPEAGAIRADPGQIEQVIMNLAVNARDAMPAGGTLALETARLTERRTDDGEGGDVVLLTVRDSGCGMDKETVSRIFEPFFTTKGVGKGTGLGLSTVYGIVAQSGGRIECESEPGRGTRFSIYLPGAAGEAQPEKEQPAAAAAARRGAETILIAEDERAVRSFARIVLEKDGYTVVEADSGKSALELLGTRTVDLLVTDVVMPEMGGRELVRFARERYPGLKVVFMSGYDVEAATMRDQSPGDAGYIQKPFASAAFLKTVRGMLDRGRG